MPAGMKRPPKPVKKAVPKKVVKKPVGKVAKAPPGPTADFFKSPTMGQAYGSQEPDSASTTTDPFAGTPYEGKTAYQIAQQIVDDEITAQKNAILQQQQLQQNANQGQLSTLAGFNQALQQAVGGIAPAFDKTLSSLGSSYQGFTKGFQDTYNQFMGEDG